MLTSLKLDGGLGVSQFEAVGKVPIGRTEADFDGKPAVEPWSGSLLVGVIDKKLDEITFIDEVSTEEEHVGVVAHVVVVRHEGVSRTLTRGNRIRSIVVEEGMTCKGEETTEETVSWLIEVVGTAEKIRDAGILDKVNSGTEKEG